MQWRILPEAKDDVIEIKPQVHVQVCGQRL